MYISLGSFNIAPTLWEKILIFNFHAGLKLTLRQAAGSLLSKVISESYFARLPCSPVGRHLRWAAKSYGEDTH